jgi:hypothetical protein
LNGFDENAASDLALGDADDAVKRPKEYHTDAISKMEQKRKGRRSILHVEQRRG